MKTRDLLWAVLATIIALAVFTLATKVTLPSLSDMMALNTAHGPQWFFAGVFAVVLGIIGLAALALDPPRAHRK